MNSSSFDQAATLRQLFKAATVRLLPVLVPDHHDPERAVWLARLVQGFARHGERTLVVDAARAQVATVLDLRARYDLLHVLRNECALSAALLEADPGLSVLPAARAFADASLSLSAMLSSAVKQQRTDLVVLLLPASQAARWNFFGRADVLLPLMPSARDINALLNVLKAAYLNALADQADLDEHQLAHNDLDTGVFRLLFLGMEATSAATLAQRIELHAQHLSARYVGTSCLPLSVAGAVTVARDLTPLVRAATGWQMQQLPLLDELVSHSAGASSAGISANRQGSFLSVVPQTVDRNMAATGQGNQPKGSSAHKKVLARAAHAVESRA